MPSLLPRLGTSVNFPRVNRVAVECAGMRCLELAVQTAGDSKQATVHHSHQVTLRSWKLRNPENPKPERHWSPAHHPCSLAAYTTLAHITHRSANALCVSSHSSGHKNRNKTHVDFTFPACIYIWFWVFGGYSCLIERVKVLSVQDEWHGCNKGFPPSVLLRFTLYKLTHTDHEMQIMRNSSQLLSRGPLTRAGARMWQIILALICCNSCQGRDETGNISQQSCDLMSCEVKLIDPCQLTTQNFEIWKVYTVILISMDCRTVRSE